MGPAFCGALGPALSELEPSRRHKRCLNFQKKDFSPPCLPSQAPGPRAPSPPHSEARRLMGWLEDKAGQVERFQRQGHGGP